MSDAITWTCGGISVLFALKMRIGNVVMAPSPLPATNDVMM